MNTSCRSPSRIALSELKGVADRGISTYPHAIKRVLDFLREKGAGGALASDIAFELNMYTGRVVQALRRLELDGEVFRRGRNWVSTDAILSARRDPKAVIARMKSELEKALFGDVGPPERVKVFLEEYHAARTLKLSEQEAWHFSLRRVLEEAGRV